MQAMPAESRPRKSGHPDPLTGPASAHSLQTETFEAKICAQINMLEPFAQTIPFERDMFYASPFARETVRTRSTRSGPIFSSSAFCVCRKAGPPQLNAISGMSE